jgi:hypothetical protein
MKCSLLLALAIAAICSAPLEAGWWHHHHHAVYAYQAPMYQAPVYQAPVYQSPLYQAPAYQAPAYQAPSCYSEAPSSALPGPWQDLLIQLAGDVVRNRMQRRQTQPGNIISPDEGSDVGSTSGLDSVRNDIRELRNDLSLRVENANSILQTQGKALVAVQNDIHALRDELKKDNDDVTGLLRDIRDEIKGLRTGASDKKSAEDQPLPPKKDGTDADGVDRPTFGAEETQPGNAKPAPDEANSTTIDLNAADGGSSLVELLRKRGDVRITVDKDKGTATITPR